MLVGAPGGGPGDGVWRCRRTCLAAVTIALGEGRRAGWTGRKERSRVVRREDWTGKDRERRRQTGKDGGKKRS